MDPDSADVDEDNSNENWGHMQFTGGGLTICSALVDWEVVGNTSMAFKLITAAARTCKGFVCCERVVSNGVPC